MKRGVFFNNFIMFLLFALVVLYMGFYIFKALYDPMLTVSAVPVSAEDSLSLTGYIVRDELLLDPISGISEMMPYEGERVAKGDTVALVYRDEQALEHKIEADGLRLRIEQLEYSKRENTDLTDASKLDAGIYEQIARLCGNADGRSLHDLHDLSLSLKNLIFKREYTFNSVDGVDELLNELNSSLSEMKSAQSGYITEIKSPESGLFSAMVDGYENVLTLELLKTIAPEDITGLPLKKSSDIQASGKLILGNYWYYAANVPESDIQHLTWETTAHMRFSKNALKEQTLNIYSVSRPQNGMYTVVFSSKQAMANAVPFRHVSADVILNTYEGIKVPKEAVRVQDGENGVYCLVGLVASFKSIDIIYEKDNYYIVSENIEDKNALRLGDEIIVKARNLEDGKVVK